MSDLTQSESDESGQTSEIKPFNTADYFEIVEVNGKRYSMCLVKECRRRIPDNDSVAQKIHLKVAHFKRFRRDRDKTNAPTSNCIPPGLEYVTVQHSARKFWSSLDPIPYFRTTTENEKTTSMCLIEDCELRVNGDRVCNLKRHLHKYHADALVTPANEDEPDKLDAIDQISLSGARKYFQVTMDGDELFSICSICGRRVNGDKPPTLKRHLTIFHNKSDQNGETSDNHDDDEIALTRASTSIEAAAIYSHFRFDIADDRMSAECMIQGCRRQVNSVDLTNLVKHLTNHNIAIRHSQQWIEMQTTNRCNVNDFFYEFKRDGQSLTQCLMKHCSYRVSEVDPINLSHHMLVVHRLRRHNAAPPMVPRTAKPTKSPEIEEKFAKINALSGPAVRTYFHSIKIRGELYSNCLVEECGHRSKGNHLSNLKRHLCTHHDVLPLHDTTVDSFSCRSPRANVDKCKTIRSYFKTVVVNGAVYSKCRVKDCDHQMKGDHLSNLARHLRKHVSIYAITDSTPNGQTMITKESIKDSAEVRKHFKIANENGTIYSQCMLPNCKKRVIGSHIVNMKNHLLDNHTDLSVDNSVATTSKTAAKPTQAPAKEPPVTVCLEKKKIAAPTRQSMRDETKVCRLCFQPQEHQQLIDIFAGNSIIASVIRFHFPADQVSEDDAMPKSVCSPCWTKLEQFHVFYLSVNSARDKFLKIGLHDTASDPLNTTECETDLDIVDDEPMANEFKVESIDIDDDDYIDQMESMENDSDCDIDETEEFATAQSITKNDFDAIFVNSFGGNLIADQSLATEDNAELPNHENSPHTKQSMATIKKGIVRRSPYPTTSKNLNLMNHNDSIQLRNPTLSRKRVFRKQSGGAS